MNVEDRLEILNLIASYGHHFDSGRVDEWVGLFTSSATFGSTVAGNLGPSFSGAEDFQVLADRAKEWLDAGVQRRHNLNNVVIFDQTVDTASVSAYLILLTTADGQDLEVVATGRYDGELVKVDGNWKIDKWIGTLDRQLDNPDD